MLNVVPTQADVQELCLNKLLPKIVKIMILVFDSYSTWSVPKKVMLLDSKAGRYGEDQISRSILQRYCGVDHWSFYRIFTQ